MFYPYSILLNKCSGSCNNINDPYAKLCFPDVIKDMNIKEWIDKGRCGDWFIWNSSVCECECENSSNFDKHLDYENCKCSKNW